MTFYPALEKNASESSEEDKHEVEDNARTIRPNRSPGQQSVPLAQAPAAEIQPIVEDYSDLATEEDEAWLEEKVADFKVRSIYEVQSESYGNLPLAFNIVVEKLRPSSPIPPRRYQDDWARRYCWSWPTFGTSSEPV